MSDPSTAEATESTADIAPDAAPEAATGVRHLEAYELPWMLRAADKIRRFVDFIGRWGAWLIIPLVLITTFDIVSRKLTWHNAAGDAFGMQIWLVGTFGRIFESTLVQELEWHFHTALWALVLGYGYIWNSHVRVDLVREHLQMRKQAWIELIGLTVFLIPFCLIVLWFAIEYAMDSYAVGEISASLVGLPNRWVIKTVIACGLVLAVISGVAVWLQVVIVLFGPQNARYPLMTLDWPEQAGTAVEGKERLDLGRAEGELEKRARAWEARRDAAEKAKQAKADGGATPQHNAAE